ncbi:MAG: glutamate synthase (NADPH) GltB1 subunit [Promethearchaeota archaeon CR_4]|nr:MAG: glutamate synthase (NADPH) GltB1 subunit [Candidatus Lokiarchaeota archaeon CR_4]
MQFCNYTRPAAGFENDRVFGACGISGFINIDGARESGEKIKQMITILKDRENGLGAGFAAYGIFPDLADAYCIQLLLDDMESKQKVDEFLNAKGTIVKDEKIPTALPPASTNPPVLWRFFFHPPATVPADRHDDYIVDLVMFVNANIDGAFCMSSGKNMAVFKGNGWSYEVADFYKIQNYKAYMWLGHSRFPTNTPGWWGGAHPFSLLDWAVVHNGEITSYGTNKRFLETYGYKCTLLTDTEVLSYLFDLLVRRHKIPLPIATLAFNPPLYDKITQMSQTEQVALKNIRLTYRSAVVNGPFSIIVGKELPVPTLISLTDRKKLRPQVCAISDDGNTVYVSSEEASFQRLAIDPTFDLHYGEVWAPKAGTAVIVELGKGLVRNGTEEPFEKLELKIKESV